MAECILSVVTAATTHTRHYQLDHQARQAILAQSDSARHCAEIDRQKTSFEALNFGCCFGQKNQPNTDQNA